MNRRQLLAGATAALTSSCIPTSPAPAAEAPLIVFGEDVAVGGIDYGFMYRVVWGQSTIQVYDRILHQWVDVEEEDDDD